MPSIPCISFGVGIVYIIIANLIFWQIGADCGGDRYDNSDPNIPYFNRPIINVQPNALCLVRSVISSIIFILFLLGFVMKCGSA